MERGLIVKLLIKYLIAYNYYLLQTITINYFYDLNVCQNAILELIIIQKFLYSKSQMIVYSSRKHYISFFIFRFILVLYVREKTGLDKGACANFAHI